MRSLLAPLCVLLGGGVEAAPVPLGSPALGPAARKQLHAESLNYAQQLLNVASQIAASYVKPVSRTALLHAALLGLYEAARRPAPANLRSELKRLATDVGLIDLLVKTREQLGPCPALRDAGALVVSCRAMTKILDPHSAVIVPGQHKNQPWGDQPVGIGLELASHFGVGPLRVGKVYPGGPAQKAGVRPGDVIVAIDGRPVRGMTSAQAAAFLIPRQSGVKRVVWSADPGLDGTLDAPTPRPVCLTLKDAGKTTREVKLEHQRRRPESVLGVIRRKDNSWNYFLDRKNGIAHIRVTALNRGTSEELRAALTRHEDELRGLILDLRWCPGGFLDEALAVAGLFLGDRLLASVRGRTDKETPYHNTQTKRFLKVPLVVLVNGQTSGGAELIAAALEDHKRALIAGQRSRGKASVQTALYLNVPGAALKLTSGVFLRPSRKNLHRAPTSRLRDDWGVRPSPKLEHRVSPEFDRRLRRWWEQQSLRPGTDRKLLPLDDPSADPQRQLALKGIRTLIKK